jgi:predicted molibdopterin-dependent oxidoreductase YjgC
VLKPASFAEVTAMAARAAELARADGDWLLIGEKKAIGLRGFHDSEDVVSVSRADAARVGVSDRNYVRVKSPTAEREFRVRLTDAVPAGVLMVGTNVHSNRCLFPLAEDELTGEVTVPPVHVSVEKTERVPVADSEKPSVWT